MKILAVETSSFKFSLCILRGAEVVYFYESKEQGKQAEGLVPAIELALAETGLQYNDFTAFAASVGPGSFTGIRIGLAAIAGISLATKIPALGISNLEALAFAGNLTPRINAGRGECYAQDFDNNLNPISQARLEEVKGNTNTPPNAELIAKLAAKYVAQGKYPPVVPLYIRPPDAKLPASL